MEHRTNYVTPTEKEKDLVLYYSELAYKDARWKIPSDFMTYEHFRRVVMGLEAQSSPGYPLCRDFPTIGDYFGNSEKLAWQESRIHETWERFQRFLQDPEHCFRIFIKQEPHKPEKVAEGRWRLIFACGLMLNILGQMLFTEQRTVEMDNWGRIPSAYGFSLFRGGWKYMKDIMDSKKLTLSCDKSSWDLFSPGWPYELKLRFRENMCLNMDERWRTMARLYYRLAYSDSRFVTSSGDLFEQEVDGIMKSGLPTTIDDNSTAQWFLHCLASIRSGRAPGRLFSVGDDTIQNPRGVDDRYLAELVKAGCKLKEVSDNIDQEFVGMVFAREGLRPAYREKHFASIVATKREDLPQTLESYLALYVHLPSYYDLYDKLARACSIPVRSKLYHRVLVDESVESCLRPARSTVYHHMVDGKIM